MPKNNFLRQKRWPVEWQQTDRQTDKQTEIVKTEGPIEIIFFVFFFNTNIYQRKSFLKVFLLCLQIF